MICASLTLIMIAYLKGTVKAKLPKNIILDTGNIGYLVNITLPLLEKITEADLLELYIYTRVLEDDISLFGFDTISDLSFFKTLIAVNGVGAKTAMEIMSQNTDKVKSALVNSDLAFLTHIPGIGKKTAERLVVELKSKVSLEDIGRLHQNIETKVSDDAFNAIMSLGYQRYEISKILKNLPTEITRVEEIITYFLRNV